MVCIVVFPLLIDIVICYQWSWPSCRVYVPSYDTSFNNWNTTFPIHVHASNVLSMIALMFLWKGYVQVYYYCQELEGYFAFWLFIPFVPFGLVVFSQFVLLGLELLGSFCWCWTVFFGNHPGVLSTWVVWIMNCLDVLILFLLFTLEITQ